MSKDPYPMASPAIGLLAGRIDRVERRNNELARALRRWRLAGAAALAASTLLALAGAATRRPPQVVEAEQFVLVDQDGTPMGRWAIHGDGMPRLGLFDPRGNLRLSLDLGADGTSGISVYDADSGQRRASLAVRADGTPGLGLFDEEGHPRASLDVGADGSSGANLYGRDGGALRAALAIRADGTPALGLFDERGQISRSIEGPGEADAGRAEPGDREASARRSLVPPSFGSRNVPVGS